MLNLIIEVYSKIIKRNKITVVLISIIYLVVILFFVGFISLEIDKDEAKPYRDKFYNAVDSAVKEGEVEHQNIKIIYNSINRESNGSLSEYGYASLIEDYLAENSFDKDNKKENIDNLVNIYKSEIEIAPYENLNNEQRRVLKSIETALKNNDEETALYNLSELNEILRSNNKNISILEKQNFWSIPIAILGLIITIIFGFVSIFKPFSYARIEEIVSNNMNSNE